MSRSLLALALLISAGCNRVAVLEGELTLPPRPADLDELWASVQVMRSSTPFEDTWAGAALEPVELTAEPQPYRFSLETKHPEGDLHVKVRFCRARTCDFLPTTPGDRPDPQAEVWFFVEHPFYLMKKDPEPTRWTDAIDAVPRCAACGSECAGSCDPAVGVCELSPGVCAPTPAPDGCVAITGAPHPTWRCDVDKCSIAGCIAGTPSDYCDTLDDGTRVHLCER